MSSSSQSLLYAELNQALAEVNDSMHPSEAHGLLCGVLCSHLPEKAPWRDWVLGHAADPGALPVLDQLYAKTAQEFADLSFTLELLLPSDQDTDLLLRVEALTLWCQGYLTGLQFVGIQAADLYDQDAKEAFHDLEALSTMHAKHALSSNTEEDEAAYAELVEYVRMATMMIYENRNEGQQGDAEHE